MLNYKELCWIMSGYVRLCWIILIMLDHVRIISNYVELCWLMLDYVELCWGKFIKSIIAFICFFSKLSYGPLDKFKMMPQDMEAPMSISQFSTHKTKNMCTKNVKNYRES